MVIALIKAVATVLLADQILEEARAIAASDDDVARPDGRFLTGKVPETEGSADMIAESGPRLDGAREEMLVTSGDCHPEAPAQEYPA